MAKKTPQKRDGCYERPDRGGWWISWTDAQGRRRQRKTDAQNITQAKAIRAAEMLRVEQAKMLGHAPPGAETFKEVADRYLKHQKARLAPSSYAREEMIRRLYLTRFDSLKISAIRKADLERYLTDRAAATSAVSVRKELVVLTHLFRLAVEWEIIPVSPAIGLKAPKLPPGRVRYLQPTELKALLEGAKDGLREIVALAVSTGMRRGEVMGLRYLDIDLQNRRILLPQTKNGESRVVYLNDMAMMVLKSVESNGETAPGDLIFSEWTPGMVTVEFGRLCRKLKIADFRFHDLRHTAASWMRMAGADTHTVAQLLGHKDMRMAARYQHLSPAFLSEAVGKLDAVFGDAAGSLVAKNGEERYQGVTAQLALSDGGDVNG
ncbi:MAG TPA: tyrosine-type recombinase/integrase [Blastocatellia bacterium]|jgi:integrase